ncbi:unnamed protein product [Eretmochelys imbricata]
MFPETALFVANYLLSRKPRALLPRRNEVEMPVYGGRKNIALRPAYSSHRGLQDYWVSPQRRYASGSTWATPRRWLLILPGNTGLSEVESVHWPSCCGLKHNLVWKYRWQNLNHYYLGKRVRRLTSL